jgi:hypothetical protein
MDDLMVIMKAQPPGDPVPQDRAQHRAQPGRKQADIGGSDHAAQRYQEDGARNDEGHPDKGFRTGNDKGDGEGPIGMAVGGSRDPFPRVIGKAVKKLKHRQLLSFRGVPPHSLVRPAAPGRDISDIFLPYRAAISDSAR